MALAMARPWKHPKTGVYWFRRTVPEGLRTLVGKWEEKRTLGTRDPAEAKRRHTVVLAEVEARWAALRGGPRCISEPEAHELAAVCYESWLEAYRSRPSEQTMWRVDLAHRMWSQPAPLDWTAGPGALPRLDPSEEILRRQEGWCRAAAVDLLAAKGLVVDEASRFKVARAIAAAIQRASLVLVRLSRGEADPAQASFAAPHRPPAVGGQRPASADLGRAPTTTDAPVTLMWLVEDWWREARASGRKPSTYQSYRHGFQGLSAYLKHDDARRVTPEDIVRFKDHRLSVPNERTGRVASAKTVKDSDLAAFKTVFGWAVVNRRLETNPAAGITLKVAKAQRLRGKGLTEAEAKAILARALRHERGEQEQANTAAAKRWVPWLMAFTGARVGELAQLRRQDVTGGASCGCCASRRRPAWSRRMKRARWCYTPRW